MEMNSEIEPLFKRDGYSTLVRNWGQHVNQISPAGISILSKQLDAKFRFTGCCNGLWCLLLQGDKKKCKFVLANPTTHELQHLPLLNVRDSCGESSCRSNKCSVSFDRDPLCALGYDNSEEDFKLLAIVKFSYFDDKAVDDNGVDLPKDFGNYSCHLTSFKKFIYSLKTNEWKEFEEIDCPWEWHLRDMSVSCNNVCYWKLAPWEEDEQPSIGLFDFSAEKFSIMPYPPDNYDRRVIDFAVIDILGFVSVVTYLKYAGIKFFRFWVCGDEGSGAWKRETKYDVFLNGVERPLGVTNHPHFGLSCWFLGSGRLDERLVRYDYDTKKTQTLGQFWDHRMTLFPHVVNTLNLDDVDGFYEMFNIADDDAVHKRAFDYASQASLLDSTATLRNH